MVEYINPRKYATVTYINISEILLFWTPSGNIFIECYKIWLRGPYTCRELFNMVFIQLKMLWYYGWYTNSSRYSIITYIDIIEILPFWTPSGNIVLGGCKIWLRGPYNCWGLFSMVFIQLKMIWNYGWVHKLT